jgi:hypothetical protein
MEDRQKANTEMINAKMILLNDFFMINPLLNVVVESTLSNNLVNRPVCDLRFYQMPGIFKAAGQ